VKKRLKIAKEKYAESVAEKKKSAELNERVKREEEALLAEDVHASVIFTSIFNLQI
jgi:hypothetical protein